MGTKKAARKKKATGAGAGGGKAAFGGPRYQAEVAAFFSVFMLAERAAVPVWALPANTTISAVRCETDQAIDDVLLLLANGGFVYIQAKTTVSLSDKADSPLRAAIDQFTRQYLHASGLTGQGVWDRPLDERDRFVLVTRSKSGSPVCDTAAELLDRLRDLDESQPMSAAARTKEEQRALAILVGHVGASWHAATGTAATDDDVRRVLSYTHIETLDTAPAEQHEREARQRLRDDVLDDPTQDAMAWTIVTHAAETASGAQSGLTRGALEARLMGDHVGLKHLRSYEHDVDVLRQRSEHSRAILFAFSTLPVSAGPVHIPRTAAAALAQVADDSSLLVIGEPGAGKSGALHDLYVQRRDASKSVILLIADDVHAPSIGTLQSDLHLDHPLLDVLRNWRNVEPGLLIVDALDSQRSSGTSTTLRRVIAAIQQEQLNWHVVASIRTFDLRRGAELQKLFRGATATPVPPELREPEFAEYRHLRVPRLTDAELAHVAAAAPPLGVFIASAPPRLADLLRVPFNLSLLAQLLDMGAGASDLANVRTQLDLLNLYWDHRVVRDGVGADARERTVRRICEAMIAQRRLRVSRAQAVDVAEGDALHELLQDHVLTEPTTASGQPDASEIAFGHHVLFDYAVARLVCRRSAPEFAALLMNRSLPLVVWPSLMMHFHYEWHRDPSRSVFWNTVFTIFEHAGIPTLSRIIGPMAAAELATAIDDLAPLVAALTGPDATRRATAAKVLQFVVMAVHAGSRPILGPDAGPWADLAAAAGAIGDPVAMYPVANLLHRAVEQENALSSAERAQYGSAARALLAFSWSDPRYRGLVRLAIMSVARTYETDPAAARMLLERVLDPARLPDVGYEEIPQLAREVERLIPIDASFVTAVYRTAFGYEETSKEATSLSDSAILGMTSHRRQDYQGAFYSLGRAFPAFLKANPQEATRALIGAVEGDEAQQTRHGEPEEASFDVAGRTAHVRTDYSRIRDAASDDLRSMLSVFEKAVASGATEGTDLPREIFDVLVQQNRLAAVWRRFLLAAKAAPAALKEFAIPLLTSTNVLRLDDIYSAAFEVMPALMPVLTPSEREAVERAILAIPEGVPAEEAEYAAHRRDRLAKVLPVDLLVTDEMIALRAPVGVQAQDETDDEPSVRTGWRGSLHDRDMERLPRDVRAVLDPLEKLAMQYRNSAPPPAECARLLEAVDAARAFIDGHPDLDPALRRQLESEIASGGRAIAHNTELSSDDPIYQRARDLLLAVSESDDPSLDPQHELQWDTEHPSLSQGARAIAAEGFVWLAHRAAAAKDEEVLAAIERLSADPVASVRSHIIADAQVLAESAQDLAWKILDRTRDNEERLAVAAQSLRPLGWLQRRDRNRSVQHASTIFRRFATPRPPELIARVVTDFLRDLYIYADDADARAWLDEVITGADPEILDDAVHGIRDAFVSDEGEPDEAAALRQRTIQFARDVLAVSAAAVRAAVSRPDFRTTPLPEAELKVVQNHARVIAGIATEVEFACGKPAKDDAPLPPDVAQRRARIVPRFLEESRELIDELIDVGLVPASHSVLDALEDFIDLDPRGTFLRIVALLRRAAELGYPQEHLGMSAVVSIVERYLADYRDLLESDDACRDGVVQILDLFIEAGWPEALRLSFRLGDLFR